MTVTIEFRDERTALAVAELCKRATNEKVAPFAADSAELRRMFDGLDDVREGLAKAGVPPR
jgi:hypothetical protein